MARSFCLTILAVLLALNGAAYADTFEFLTYTPPPGWTNQPASDGSTYRRPSGVGLIYFYSSYPATGSASDEFVRIWRARLEKAASGFVPQTKVERMGDLAVAIGGTKMNMQGGVTSLSLVTFVGRGRALGVLGMATGEDAQRELMTFFDTLEAIPATSPTLNTGSLAPGGIEVEFDVPAGYVVQRDGNTILLKPTTVSAQTPCVYGISPARKSLGGLDRDASAAILEALPGWQLKNNTDYNAWKGTAGAGWPYFWFRTDVGRLQGGSYTYLIAMTLAFPAGPGRVNVLWGYGSVVSCTLDDVSFARLFQSLRPRGWTSDGGKALAQELLGTWRDSQTLGIAQYRFLPNGRYEYGLATSVTTGNLERTTGGANEGRYELLGSDLVLTPDQAARGITRLRVRIYDDLRLGKWTRTLSLLNESGNPARDVHYLRVGN